MKTFFFVATFLGMLIGFTHSEAQAGFGLNDPPGSPLPVNEIEFENRCRFPVELAIKYQNSSDGKWKVKYWWNIKGNKKTFLASSNVRLTTRNPQFYYYAHIPGRDYSWNGSHRISIVNKKYSMRSSSFGSGNGNSFFFSIDCKNL